MDPKGKNILVVGMGQSGLAAALYLKQRGANVRVTDRGVSEASVRILKKTNIEFETHGHTQSFMGCPDLIVVSPGVPPRALPLVIAEKNGIPVLSEVEIAYQKNLKEKIIAVTGTNGKTTTTALIHHIITCSGQTSLACGNYGAPLSQVWLENHVKDWFVCELSSYQLERIDRFSAHIAVFLNLTPDHMDRYERLEDYLGAKMNLCRNLNESDWVIADFEDFHTALSSFGCRAKQLYISMKTKLNQGAWIDYDALKFHIPGFEAFSVKTNSIKLTGRHNLQNVLASGLAALLAQVQPVQITEALQSFKGLKHRLEYVAECRGVRFFNDSKATNVSSAKMALESFNNPILWIVGGMSKNADFGLLKKSAQKHVKYILAFGEAKMLLEKVFHDICPVKTVEDLSEAVQESMKKAEGGDVVLLSPACASMDMFKNYEERGEAFCASVKDLSVKSKSLS